MGDDIVGSSRDACCEVVKCPSGAVKWWRFRALLGLGLKPQSWAKSQSMVFWKKSWSWGIQRWFVFSFEPNDLLTQATNKTPEKKGYVQPFLARIATLLRRELTDLYQAVQSQKATIWLWVKNTGYPKKPGLVKEKHRPKALVPKGWHLFDPSRHFLQFAEIFIRPKTSQTH